MTRKCPPRPARTHAKSFPRAGGIGAELQWAPGIWVFCPLGCSTALNKLSLSQLSSPFRSQVYNCATGSLGGLGRKIRMGPTNPLFSLQQNHWSFCPILSPGRWFRSAGQGRESALSPGAQMRVPQGCGRHFENQWTGTGQFRKPFHERKPTDRHNHPTRGRRWGT